MYRPPYKGVVKAAVHEEDYVLPLGVDEQRYALQAAEFVLVFREKAEPDRMAGALEQVLASFPPCAGRFIMKDLVTSDVRTPLTIQAEYAKKSVCILCNNAGAGWSALEFSDALPSVNGPMANSLVDFISDIEPTADGRLGGPLFTATLSSFIDGQTLGLSFAQGLCDCGGINLFLRTWSSLYRGEDPGPSPLLSRLQLDDLFRRLEAGRVKVDFALLNKSRSPMPKLAPEKSVVSFTWSADEVQSRILDIQNERKNRNLTLDRAGKNLEALDVGCAPVLLGFQAQLPVQMWVDYRPEFEVPSHFGNARGQIAFDTPVGYEDIAETIRRRVFGAHRVDFWGWQRTQNTKLDPTGLTIFPLLDTIKLEDLCFHSGDIPRVGLPLCLWEEQMKSPGYIAVLPEPSGGCHVEALVPRAIADQVSKRVNCQVFPIR